MVKDILTGMKKPTFIILIIGFVFFGFASALAAQNEAEINFFYSPTCPHCKQEKEFLTALERKYPELEIKQFSIFEKENFELLKEFHRKYEVAEEDQRWIPVTFTKERYFLGFNEAVAEGIESCIRDCLAAGTGGGEEAAERKLSLPFFGAIDVSKFSPLALAVILGGLDGFNPCAMVALGFLLAVLVGSGMRKRVFLIGGTFIFVSGFVYLLFMSAWLNLLIVMSHIKLITFLIGVVIILFAIFLLRDYFMGVVCKLCHVDPKKQGISAKFTARLLRRMQQLIHSDRPLPFILLGVAGVGAGINMVELVCSFGFPLAFTKTLTASGFPTFSYYFYLLIYIIFYMLDDFLIFLLAVLTLRITQVSQKYLKVITLISGVSLLILGLIMLFRPEILSFG